MSGKPYLKFGNLLKNIRLGAKESVVELSGAVETDPKILKSIEEGNVQPAEDLVLLLISHFALKDDEALKLWELAGYEQSKTGQLSLHNDDKGIINQTAVISSNDARIIYTDMVHVNANRYGVVINFMQGLGLSDQPLSISRVGMSHEHAKSLIEVLQKTIQLSNKKPSTKKQK